MHKLIDYRDKDSLVFRLRSKRIKPLLSMIEAVYRKNGQVRILDVGGTKRYWRIVPDEFLKKNKVQVTILNLSLPKVASDEIYRFMAGDACDLSGLKDNTYDIVHSNSVIEHVGDFARMEKFSNEIRRLARLYFVQTPNFWFPVEPHCMTLFFHWLPKSWRVFLVMRFSLGNWSRQYTYQSALSSVNSAALLKKKRFASLFPDADIKKEWLLFLPKSLIAIKNNLE